MPTKEVASLFVELRGTFAKFSADIQGVSKTMSGLQKDLSKSFKGLDKLVNAVVGVTALYGIKKLSDAVVELAKQGDQLQDLTDSFNRLGGNAAQLRAAQDAILGTASSMDLMKIANEGILKQIPGFNENFGKIAELGGRVAQSLGIDAKEGIERVAEALASAKEKQLSGIGVTINADKAYRDYAASIGLTAKQLNDAQQKEARQIAAIGELSNAIERLAPMTDSVADAQQAWSVTLTESIAQMGAGVNNSTALRDAYRDMGAAAKEVDWERVGENIAKLAAIVMGQMVPAIKAGEAVLDNFVRGLQVLQQLPAFDFNIADAAQFAQTTQQIESQGKAAQDAAAAMKKLQDITVFKGDTFALTHEGLTKAAEAVRDLESAVSRGGPMTEKYSDALKKGQLAVKNYTMLLGEASPVAKKHGEISQKALDDEAKAAKKAADEIQKLKEKWDESVQDFNQKSIEEGLKKQIEGSIDKLDASSFANLRQQLSDAVKDGYIKTWQESVDKGVISESELQAQAARVADVQTSEWAEQFKEKSESAYKDGIEMWSGLFENAITGATFDLESALKQVAVGFAANMAQSLFGGLGGIKSPGDLGGAIFSSLFGGGGAAGGGIGQMLGLGGGAAGLLGSFGMSGAAAQAAGIAGPAMESGMFASGSGILGALGPIGIGALGAGALFGSNAFGIQDAIGGLFGGGGPQNKETVGRNSVLSKLEEMLSGKNFSFFDKGGKQSQRFSGDIMSGGSDRFNNPDWAKQYQKTEGFGTFDAIGKGLTKLLGVTEDVGGQIGFILSENLNGNLDNARILMAQLGVSEQDMTDAFIKSGEEGSMSWHAVEVALQGVSAAFGEGLVAVGDMAGGFQQIVDSGGDGMDAILGIKNAAVEAGEAGVTSFDQWKQSLLAAGSDPAYVDAFFTALNQRGLASLEEIKNATTRDLGGVIADMESLSPALAEQWHVAQAEAQKYADTIAKIPDDSVKNIELNVKANISDDAKKALNLADNTQADVASATPFAKGGVVTKPTLGLVGEAGPEYIAPLSTLPGLYKSMSSMGGGESKGVNLTINAPNAEPGVEDRIRRMVKDLEFDIINRAVDTVQDLGRRGGA